MRILTTRLNSYLAFTLPVIIFALIANQAIANPAKPCLKSINNSAELEENITSKNTSKNSDVVIEFITHSTFRITSPKGLIIEVDYTGISSNKAAPNIITLNHTSMETLAHQPVPKTKNVLAPWSDKTQKSQQLVLVKNDVSIRNFQTDVYENGALKILKKNSVFIFKVAGLCIAHLGNIQHVLSDAQLELIGNIDIIMAPVSGRNKFTTTQLANLLIELNAKIIILMHWKDDVAKQDFMADISSSFSIAGYPTNALSVSTKTLPKSATIVTMIPKYEQNEAEYSKHH